MPGSHWYSLEIYRNAQCNQTIPRVRRKNYLAAGQRARRRHPKTIWHWDIEVVQNLKECTENLLSSGGAGGLPAGAILFGQSVRKNRQNARKAERFAKTSPRTRILLEIQESHFEDVEDLDEAVEGGRGASRHHRKHQQRLFGRHRNSFRLPCSVGCGIQSSEILAVIGSIATGCTLFVCFVEATKDTGCPF